jgi:hypothetical protein
MYENRFDDDAERGEQAKDYEAPMVEARAA